MVKTKKPLKCGCLKYVYFNGGIEYLFCEKHKEEAANTKISASQMYINLFMEEEINNMNDAMKNEAMKKAIKIGVLVFVLVTSFLLYWLS